MLLFYNDHFQAHRVSEKGTKCKENNLMRFCLTIIIDKSNIKRVFDNLKVMFDQAYIVFCDILTFSFSLNPSCFLTAKSTTIFSTQVDGLEMELFFIHSYLVQSENIIFSGL